jgi:hypothetical protein
MTATHSKDAGVELVALLKQQRLTYHQLKILTDRRDQLADIDSPELALQFIFGRRKLLQKLNEIESKLRPIKAHWERVADHCDPDDAAEACELALEVNEIVEELESARENYQVAPLALVEHCRFSEVFAPAQV